jgi:hypothetical protein
MLTRLLAPRCDRLLAMDFAAAATARARTELMAFPHVQIKTAGLPEDMPEGPFDLIVVSEILYYLAKTDLDATINALVSELEPGGDLVAVHHRAADRCYGYDGFNVHCTLATQPELATLMHLEDQEFVLDVLRRTEPSR